jgi:methylase of polypeptide subunit release factors
MRAMRSSKNVTLKKETGSHFTPPELAHFVASRIINVLRLDSLHSLTVLDPACGDGELLLAFAKSFPLDHLQRVTFLGVESDALALERARERLITLPMKRLELMKADFLKLCNGHLHQSELFDDATPQNTCCEKADIIIANPPYVRTQVLGSQKAQNLAKQFALTGRVDLYHAFLIAMTESLVPGGIMGVITSNRYLSTNGGASIRQFMASQYEILEVFDLGDTKLFEAAVLPSVFIGRRLPQNATDRKRSSHAARFVRIYEQFNEVDCGPRKDREADSIYTLLEAADTGIYRISGRRYKVSTGSLVLPPHSTEPWVMATSDERAWLNTVNTRAKFRVCDLAIVRVGIKTTADEVFIRKDWSDLPEDVRPEKELLHPLLSHDCAERWLAKGDCAQSRQVLYTHEIRKGLRATIELSEYPKAFAYLQKHRTRLEARAYVREAGRKWYEIWVPQDPAAWIQPKLVFPDISPEPLFFYDLRGCIVDGNCYWIVLKPNQDPDLLFLIQGVANSSLMTHYHDLSFSNKLYAGRRRYLTQYVQKYPIPNPTTEPSRQIISLVKDLVSEPLSEQALGKIEYELELLVASAFDVDPVFAR